MAAIGGLQLSPTNYAPGTPATGPSIQHDVGQLFGHALNALPGYSTLGQNITNPKVNYKGIPNPGYGQGAPAQQGTITNPNTPQPDQNLTPDTSGYATGGGTSTSAADAAAAAAAAAQTAKVQQFRTNILGLSKSIMDVYDQLYGAVNTAGADQAKQVNQKYDTQTKGLGDQFAQDFPTVGASYAANGVYNSGYRQVAEDNASKAFGNQLDLQGQGRQADLGKVGQFVSSTQGNINAERGGIHATLDLINQTEDPNELLSLQNAIQAKLQAAQSDQSNLGTQGGYAAQAESLVPSADQTGALQQQLTAILQGQAAPVLKNSVGQKLISNSGLSPEDQKKLSDAFVTQLSTTPPTQPQG